MQATHHIFKGPLEHFGTLFSEKLAWVNVLKLRAVRPHHLIQCHDHVPFHRESLYAVTPQQVKYQYNIWIPCSRAATSSGLLYFPGSHLIDDIDLQILSSKIITTKNNDINADILTNKYTNIRLRNSYQMDNQDFYNTQESGVVSSFSKLSGDQLLISKY